MPDTTTPTPLSADDQALMQQLVISISGRGDVPSSQVYLEAQKQFQTIKYGAPLADSSSTSLSTVSSTNTGSAS